MKRLLPFKPGKVDNDTKVMKVKVYVDPPRPIGSNNSIGNSTLTMPKELQRSNTSDSSDDSPESDLEHHAYTTEETRCNVEHAMQYALCVPMVPADYPTP